MGLILHEKRTPAGGAVTQAVALRELTFESGSEVGYNLVIIFWKKILIFIQAGLFLVLIRLGSVFSPEMDSTSSQLHVASGFLKKDYEFMILQAF